MAGTNIIRPQAGFQQMFTRTNVDFCVGGGVLNAGKSFASVLAIAELSKEPTFTALYLRNNLGDAKAGGGIIDTFKSIFGNTIKVVESGDPHIDFPNGRVDITHVDNQDPSKILQRFKGRQYDLIVFDEGTGFEWSTFKILSTRNRGRAKWTGHMLMTTNPDKDHWLRTFIDWYVGDDGFIREDRNGVVRYFYVNGESVNDVVWGDTKEEVYDICRIAIDRKLKGLNKHGGKFQFKWEDLIRSFTFYLGSMSENVASIGSNSGYAGSVAMAGGRTAEQLIEGNWNVSTKGDLDAPISNDVANHVFVNDPQINGDKWVTADLADYGTDNFIAIVWDGFHIMDVRIVQKSTPRENAVYIQSLCAKYDIGESHVIFDATSGMYLKDYLPQSLAYYSMKQPMGIYSKGVCKLKDECYERLVSMINRRAISCEEKIGKQNYTHAKIHVPITIQNEFAEECSVVRFRDATSGKKALITKREMRQMLGKSRSTDLLDPIAMRMMPILKYANGDELAMTGNFRRENDDNDGIYVNVYDNAFWC